MRRIYKYVIEPQARVSIRMPHSSRLLSVQDQYGYLTLWAEVDPTMHTVYRNLLVCVTGQKAPTDALCYVGTAQMVDGHLVYHVYDAGEKCIDQDNEGR